MKEAPGKVPNRSFIPAQSVPVSGAGPYPETFSGKVFSSPLTKPGNLL